MFTLILLLVLILWTCLTMTNITARKGKRLSLPSIIHCLLLNKQYFTAYLLKMELEFSFPSPSIVAHSSSKEKDVTSFLAS